MPQTLRPTDDMIVKTRRELHDLTAAYSQLQEENMELIKENGHLAVENNRLRERLEKIHQLAEEANCWSIAGIARAALERER